MHRDRAGIQGEVTSRAEVAQPLPVTHRSGSIGLRPSPRPNPFTPDAARSRYSRNAALRHRRRLLDVQVQASGAGHSARRAVPGRRRLDSFESRQKVPLPEVAAGRLKPHTGCRSNARSLVQLSSTPAGVEHNGVNASLPRRAQRPATALICRSRRQRGVRCFISGWPKSGLWRAGQAEVDAENDPAPNAARAPFERHC